MFQVFKALSDGPETQLRSEHAEQAQALDAAMALPPDSEVRVELNVGSEARTILVIPAQV